MGKGEVVDVTQLTAFSQFIHLRTKVSDIAIDLVPSPLK